MPVLSPEAWDALQRLLNDPSPPNEALMKAAQHYRAEVAAGRLKDSTLAPLDRNLLTLYLQPQPGTYHRRDDDPTSVYHNGQRIVTINADPKVAPGMAAVLVYLLNHCNGR